MPRKTVLILAAFLAAGSAGAGENSVGTTGANFLKIAPAPIPAALGTAYTALSGPDSILYNPAGLGLMNYTALSVAFNNYAEGIKQEYFALALRTRLGTFGAAISALSSGDFDAYDEHGARIGTTSSAHQLFVASYSQSWPHWNQDKNMQDRRLVLSGWSKIKDVEAYRPATPRVSLGASFKYIHERLDDADSSAVSADAGVMLVPLSHVQLGAAVQNITGKQNFGGEDSSLPRTYRAGIASDFISKERSVIIKPSIDYVRENDRKPYCAAGVEINVLETMQIRFGARSERDLGSDVTFGVGLTLDRYTDEGYFMRGARVDYAYVGMGAFGGSHRIGFQLLF